jgi:hypothetical protein
VRDEGLTDVGSRSCDEVEDTGRQADVVDDLGEDERCQRRQLARLQDDGAAGGECGSDLEHDLVQRVVPGRDAPHDADGLLDDLRCPDHLREVVVGGDLREAGHVHDRQHRLRDLRDPEGHAVLLGDRRRDLVGTGLEAFVDPLEELRAVLDRGLAPAVERSACGLDGLVDVLRGALGDAPHDLLGGRVDHVDAVLARRCDPRAVDVDLVPLLHVPHAFASRFPRCSP